MEQDVNDAFKTLKTSSKAYIKSSLILLKLNVYEKTALLLGVVSYSLVFMIISVIALIFMFLLLGFVLSYIFESLILGFLAVFLLCVASLMIVYFLRNDIKKAVINTVISTLEDNDKSEKILTDGNEN
ncbi:MAG: hypothetical protein PHD21_04035 [Flavobacteriales bacterium]|nr:hypothetical protein [Flavobacteriales bacterium]